MTQFHEGQEVEVRIDGPDDQGGVTWRKAKIVRPDMTDNWLPGQLVEFADGTRAVFATNCIR